MTETKIPLTELEKISPEAVLSQQSTRTNGLSEAEAAHRLSLYGPNQATADKDVQ